MALFELEDGRLVPAQFGREVEDGFTPDVLDSVREQVLQIVSRPLFPITWRDISNPNDDSASPRLTALDASGQVVAVEVVQALDAELLIDSLSRLADTASMSWTDLAREFPGGIEGFKAGWTGFRQSMPPSPPNGPRLIIVASRISEDVRPALDVLSSSGVEVHEMSMRQMANGRAFLDVAVVGPRLYGHRANLLMGDSTSAAGLPAVKSRANSSQGGTRRSTPPAVTGSLPAAVAEATLAAPAPIPAAAPVPAPNSATGINPASVEKSVDRSAQNIDEEIKVAPPKPPAAAPVAVKPVLPVAQTAAEASKESRIPATGQIPIIRPGATPSHTPPPTGAIPVGVTSPDVLRRRSRASAVRTQVKPVGSDPIASATSTNTLRDGTNVSVPVAPSVTPTRPKPVVERVNSGAPFPTRRQRREAEAIAAPTEQQLSDSSSALSALGSLLGRPTPLALDMNPAPKGCKLDADGLIHVPAGVFQDPTQALVAEGIDGVDGWAAWHLGDKYGPTLKECIEEITRDSRY